MAEAAGSRPRTPGEAGNDDLRPPHRYVLPDDLRKDLGKPFGPVVAGDALPAAVAGATLLVAVGDVVSLTCKTLGLEPAAFLCDFMTQRGTPDPTYEAELGSWGTRAFRVANPPATITRQAWDAVRLALSAGPQPGAGPVRIVVDGEEDLLGIPCFLEAPDGAVVLYGMPGQGVVVVRVDATLRRRVADVLAKFTRE